jgi:CHAD domain-containing protein
MSSEHREVERKYEPPEHSRLPPLRDLPGVTTVDPPVWHDLEAVYFDTDDLALAAAGVTVRRRSGGDDTGWHVKLPAADGARDEVRAPLGRATRTVPKPLRSAVQVHVRDRPMGPVATLRTRRRTHRLLGDEGQVLAEVCDDSVSANTPSDDEPTTWREWEVELVEGEPGLLEAADTLLREAGAAPSASTSKLARVLGDRAARHPCGPRSRPSRDGPAAFVVHTRLCEQVAELKARDPQVRRDMYDGVHKMRVALRRLRSALATFRPLLDAEVTEPLRAEMRWLAGALGEARDAEVMHARLREMLAEQPRALVLGAVRRRVDTELGGAYKEAHAASLEAMETARYFALLDHLDALVADPPWTALAQQPAREVLPPRVRRDVKRLRRRVDAVDDADSGPERDERLHEVRKAAKRVRYAAETLEPVYGGDATRLADATRWVQSALGNHRDSVLTTLVLRRLAVEAHRDGDNAFTYGVLHAHEQRRGVETEAEYVTAWENASRKKLRRWLS